MPLTTLVGVAVEAQRPERALAVYAHPDDPEVSCGGTLARWSSEGSEILLVICTAGEKGSSDPATDPGDLAARRAAEVAAAVETMGLAGWEALGHPDGELENTVELRSRIVGLIRRHRPDVVVCPDPTAVFFGSGYVNHHDHRSVGFATLDAVAPAASSPLYHPEAGPAHVVSQLYLSGTLEPDTWVDVGDHLDTKIAALRCHESQIAGRAPVIEEAVRRRAEDSGRQAGVGYAEGFRRLTLAG